MQERSEQLLAHVFDLDVFTFLRKSVFNFFTTFGVELKSDKYCEIIFNSYLWTKLLNLGEFFVKALHIVAKPEKSLIISGKNGWYGISPLMIK